MKKLIYIAIFLLGFTSYVNANGINIGVSITGGVFDATGSEVFSGDHASNASSTKVTKKSSAEGEDVETLFGFGSIFIEKEISDQVSIGLDYVPTGLDSETTENIQRTGNNEGTGAPGSEVTNKVSVSFNDMRTAYVKFNTPVGAYVKIGLMEVDLDTNANLGPGGAYGNATISGMSLGLGYNHDLANDMFVRVEGNLMDFDDVSLTNTNDSTKTINANDIDGYGARISVGKSF